MRSMTGQKNKVIDYSLLNSREQDLFLHVVHL